MSWNEENKGRVGNISTITILLCIQLTAIARAIHCVEHSIYIICLSLSNHNLSRASLIDKYVTSYFLCGNFSRRKEMKFWDAIHRIEHGIYILSQSVYLYRHTFKKENFQEEIKQNSETVFNMAFISCLSSVAYTLSKICLSGWYIYHTFYWPHF